MDGGTLTITIDLSNDKTLEPEDIADALEQVKEGLADGKGAGWIHDVNGNRVGTFNTEEGD